MGKDQTFPSKKELNEADAKWKKDMKHLDENFVRKKKK